MTDPTWAPPPPAGDTAHASPAEPTPGAAQRPAAPPRRTRRTGGGAGRDVLIVLGTFVVLGVLCGVLWWLLAPTPEFTKVRGGGNMDELDLGRGFGIVGWYVVIAGVAGLAAGLALSWWRDRDPLLTSGLLVLGSALAAALMALVGHLLGPGDPQAALAVARIGAKVPEQLRVGTLSVYLVWPVAVLVGTLVVLWGRLPVPAGSPSDDESSSPGPDDADRR